MVLGGGATELYVRSPKEQSCFAPEVNTLRTLKVASVGNGVPYGMYPPERNWIQRS